MHAQMIALLKLCLAFALHLQQEDCFEARPLTARAHMINVTLILIGAFCVSVRRALKTTRRLQGASKHMLRRQVIRNILRER
jgi:hypothetical protein